MLPIYLMKAPPRPPLAIYMSLFVNHFYESNLAIGFINPIFVNIPSKHQVRHIHPAFLISWNGMCRNKNKVIMNDQCGYLLRTKVSSSDEGGVAAGFAVLDSIYLT